MANMIWTFIVMFVMHDAQGFFPTLEEVKNRTRWCLGEGAHCPINLLHSFSSCCKPYLCMEVPKTCKPAFLLKFTHYTDHRCMLPPNITQVVKEPAFNESVSATELVLPVDEHVSAENNATLQLSTNKTFVNNSDLGEYDNSYENNVSSSNETYLESNETSQSHNEESSSETTDTSQSYNKTNTLESENSSLESTNFSPSPQSKKTGTDSKTSQVTDSSEYSDCRVNNTSVKNSSLSEDTRVENNTLLPSTISPDVAEEEDWTSSEMTYDTRPVLHKVVTIHPFRLFHTVEVIKLNESAERSY